MKKQEENQTLNNQIGIKQFKLVNLREFEKGFCILFGAASVLFSLVSRDVDFLLAAMVGLIATVGYFSVKNTYLESKIESFNLILSVLANGERLSPKALEDKVSSISFENNKDVLLIRWGYHEMLRTLIELGYICMERDWSQDQLNRYFFKLTEKGLALAKKQEPV